MTVFLVLILIFLVLIAIIVAAATGNRQANMQMGPMYIDQPPVIIDDTPLIAGMIAADIATDIAFSESMHMGGMGGMDQGQYFDQQDSGFGGGDFLGGDQSFDSGSSGFDIGGGGDF
jgi:uncharacterized membrane protein YgcG